MIKLTTYIYSPRWITIKVENFIRNIIDNKEYDILPILADLLEDKGYINRRILNDLRSGQYNNDSIWTPIILLQLLNEKKIIEMWGAGRNNP